jgi:hypothetical protein
MEERKECRKTNLATENIDEGFNLEVIRELLHLTTRRSKYLTSPMRLQRPLAERVLLVLERPRLGQCRSKLEDRVESDLVVHSTGVLPCSHLHVTESRRVAFPALFAVRIGDVPREFDHAAVDTAVGDGACLDDCDTYFVSRK